MRLLLVTPPMTQLNTPYPATAYLTGFLRRHRPEVEVRQADAALLLFLRLFSRAGLVEVRARLAARFSSPPRSRGGRGAEATSATAGGGGEVEAAASPAVQAFLAQGERYLDTVEAAVRFLQGRDPSLALRIVGRDFLPEGPRFSPLRDEETLDWAFGPLGTQDQAKHLASLFVDDIADVLRDGIDPRFELSRYGERLAASAASFDGLRAALDGPRTLIDETLDGIAAELAELHRPDLLGLTVPFPGNTYGAFRLARAMRRHLPGLKVAMGGGYVNTELRALADPRVFDDIDYVTLDSGERPLLCVLDHVADDAGPLFRTFVRGPDGAVVLRRDVDLRDVAFRELGAPTYAGLPLGDYVSILELLNPMHRLWSDGRWNKLTVAHGCYWKQCTFCDISLDYIARYEVAPADELVDRIEALVRETGQTGFHFVDEAAPPAALKALAERLIARGVVISWWGNIRFEKAFTPALAALLARSGCVAVSGGLEVASDRLLALMKKGVTVEQVARVTHAFTEAGVMVHAYLMYGFPSETAQETVDALERVRQLFEAGCLQSAFWHRFAATAHSPIGLKPELYGIRLTAPAGAVRAADSAARALFAHNDLAFEDAVGCDHDGLAQGLRKAVYNYMHGIGLDADVRQWFDVEAGGSRPTEPRGRRERRGKGRAADAPAGKRARIPAPQVPPDLIRRALLAQSMGAASRPVSPSARARNAG